MGTWLCVTFGLALGTAIVPIASIELFLIGLVAHRPDIPWLALGAVTAAGQVSGKLVHYYAARGAMRLPIPVPRRARLEAAMARAVDRAHERPRWMHGIFGASAVFGLPPFAVTTILAGATRMRLSVFLAAGLVGRFIRYSALAAAPAAVGGLLF
jgi:membrane protein YqaA with SNARE-associated domain